MSNAKEKCEADERKWQKEIVYLQWKFTVASVGKIVDIRLKQFHARLTQIKVQSILISIVQPTFEGAKKKPLVSWYLLTVPRLMASAICFPSHFFSIRTFAFVYIHDNISMFRCLRYALKFRDEKQRAYNFFCSLEQLLKWIRKRCFLPLFLCLHEEFIDTLIVR